MTRILITGFAGSGKSSVCAALEKRGYTAFDMEEVDGLFSMIDTRTGRVFEDYDNADLEKVKHGSWTCDREALEKHIEAQGGGLQFYCGSASNLAQITPYFKEVVLLVAGKDTLRARLSMRSAEEFGSTSQVQTWAFAGKEQYEQNLIQAGATVVHAEQPLESVVDAILSLARESRAKTRGPNA
jgi:broad-specificity NMP kinase